jgi:bifunctional UDP-N-acetylglucosamine pyrophosphorylase / glucosamine-1-phosphate N-acetyltransferase
VSTTEYAGLILAAGKGTRMKSNLCKVLHRVAGRPMMAYVIDTVKETGISKLSVIVGHQAVEVKRLFSETGIDFVLQEPQLGTGHAVSVAAESLGSHHGSVLVLCADIPLLRHETLFAFMRYHEDNKSRLTVMTTRVGNPFGYGRIVRQSEDLISRIVEERDATDQERTINEINTGVYLVDRELLFDLVGLLENNNAQGEYYITDIVGEAVTRSIPVHAFVLDDFSEALGINTRSELAAASAVVWKRTRQRFMDSGVTLLDPNSAYIDSTVAVGPDTVIHPNVTIIGATSIGGGCEIESGVYVLSSRLGNGVRILQGSRVDNAQIDDFTTVGPMAHLRPQADIGKNARIGNFVEVKKSVVGDGSKAAHLTYLGDSLVGSNVNIGCGTITCNYDGKKKHRTVIGDNCFVGSDVQFVAPVEIGEGSVIGAGSTITKDVPPRSLAVSRSKQKMFPLRQGQGLKSADEDRKP